MTLPLGYVLVTWNRRERLLSTLSRLPSLTPLAPDEYEIWVIDNASTDGTAEAVRERFPHVRLVRQERNTGMAARNVAFRRGRVEHWILIDDDSFPTGGAVRRMLEHLEARPHTGAVVGRVILPGGQEESPALPGILAGGASCVRARALEEAGYFPENFFRQAEEYDLSFRLWQAGYSIDRREDAVFRHEKAAGGRDPSLIHRLDTRNNLVVLDRYFPRELARIYREDWTARYRALARHAGRTSAARRGRLEAWLWSLFRRLGRGGRPLDADVLEKILAWNTTEEAVREFAAEKKIERVLLVDYSKNIYASHRACERQGLEMVAVLDENPAYRGQSYRGIPVVGSVEALERDGVTWDGVILTASSPARDATRGPTLEEEFPGRVLRLGQELARRRGVEVLHPVRSPRSEPDPAPSLLHESLT